MFIYKSKLFALCSYTDFNLAAAEAAQNVPLGSATAVSSDVVSGMFKNASAAGFNTVRIFLNGDSPDFQFQIAPGDTTSIRSNIFNLYPYSFTDFCLLNLCSAQCNLLGAKKIDLGWYLSRCKPSSKA